MITISPVTTFCVACTKRFFQYSLTSKEKSNQLSQLFCDVLFIDIHVLPAESQLASCSRGQGPYLPLCHDCLVDFSQVLELNIQLNLLQSRINKVKARLRSRVVNTVSSFQDGEEVGPLDQNMPTNASQLRSIHELIRQSE